VHPDLCTVVCLYLHALVFLRATGLKWEDVKGKNCKFLQGPETEASAVEELRAALSEKRSARVSITNYNKDGQQFRNLLSILPVTEFASDADAAAQRDGVYRYVIGVQHVFAPGAASQAELSAQLVRVSTLIDMLPTVIVKQAEEVDDADHAAHAEDDVS
jgi:hypothetical protein